MVPIFEERPDGSRGYDFAQFNERFAEICAEHRKQGRALAFAFLLFDVDTPEFTKALRDEDYWRALDSVSGSYLSVFTLVTHQPRAWGLEPRSPSGIGPVTNPGHKIQLVLSRHFRLNEGLTLPAALLFQVNEGAVTGSCLVQLKATAIETAFTEVRELLRDVVHALANSGGAGHSQAGAAFDAVKSRLRKRTLVRYVKDGAKVLWQLKDIAGLPASLT